MPFRQHASIQRKLTFVILSTSLLGLSVACLAFEIYERASYRGALTSDLSALASTLGANTTASLAFNDHQSAVDILKGLRAEPHVLAACLYDKRGQLFVEYQRGPGGPDCNRPVLRQDGARFETGSVTVFRNVVLDGDVAGGIAIISDLDGLHAKIRQYTVIAAVVMLLSTLTTFLVSSRLIRLITQPILKLADIAGRVSEHQDYSLRAEAGTNDEVGTLISSFNDMLEGIQERDWALQMVNDQLETRVEERTWALQQEVADRTAAEAKLQSSLKELEDLKFALDQHCIVARTDPNGAITFVNEKFCSVSKYSREELIGQTHRLINSQYHPGEFMAELWRTIESGQVWKGELRNRAKTGEIYWVDTTIVPFCDSRGKPLQFIAIRSDITALKTIENDLRAAKEAAEAASRAKSEFLANMSHEIRTPLNGVMGMTELALETHLTAEQREYLETVKTSADSLLTVINDILDFSKIEAGKIDLEDVNFNLRESLESTLKTVALRADQKGLELLCDVAPDVPEIVRGDSTRLRQVVINLVGNAIKFTDQGEIAVKVQVQSQEDPEPMLRFTVSDTGIGIPKDKLELIFAPFSQADTSTTRKYGGTGLGLTISTRLVRMMGGRLWVESEVGKGSQFHFTTRLNPAEGQEIKIDNVAAPEILRNVRVLVVDDNRTNRRILEGTLRHWGMRPASVDGGQQALDQVSAARVAGDPFGLILTDSQMPNMNGFTLIEHIRQNSELSAAAIMMLTSAGQRGDARRCQELGIAAYLLKPVRQSELREAIARVLGAHEQGGALPLITRFSLQDVREQGVSLRILLAEDNPVNQRLAVRLLEKRGHTVKVAGNGRQALEALDSETFDLLFMDVQMPEMDGLEATAAIREKEKGGARHQPIVALTAHAMKGDQEKCLAAGMDGYLTKPIRPQELDDILDGFVSRGRLAARAMEAVEQRK